MNYFGILMDTVTWLFYFTWGAILFAPLIILPVWFFWQVVEFFDALNEE